MKSLTQSIPGYRIHEYMVVLHPPAELREKIGHLRKDFSEKYRTNILTPGKTHIMLASFNQYAMMEERVITRLRTVAMGFRPFKIEMKDFGSYPTHSIFVQVTTREPIRNLIKELKQFQQLLTLNKDEKPRFGDDPQILIARKLLAWQYEKGWSEFAQRQFTARFIADNMLLLKRRQGEKAWQIVERLEFRNLPVTIRQGELF